jgi:hypothetical protein
MKREKKVGGVDYFIVSLFLVDFSRLGSKKNNILGRQGPTCLMEVLLIRNVKSQKSKKKLCKCFEPPHREN